MALKRAKFYPYDQVPVSDTTWSLHTGPDRRIYAAACIETRGGCAVIVARYNAKKDALDYVFDVGQAADDPPDSGRATQCKIHYSFAPSERDGILYAATHASAPARGDFFFNVNADWGDERKAFRGSVLVAYDTREDRVLWGRPFIPREGCRCLAYDEERGRIYAVSWPRDHFLSYDLKTARLTDYGRLGSLNPQAIWLDSKRRAYTTADNGRIVRFDPDRDRLEELDLYLPRARYLSGWHTVVPPLPAGRPPGTHRRPGPRHADRTRPALPDLVLPGPRRRARLRTRRRALLLRVALEAGPGRGFPDTRAPERARDAGNHRATRPRNGRTGGLRPAGPWRREAVPLRLTRSNGCERRPLFRERWRRAVRHIQTGHGLQATAGPCQAPAAALGIGTAGDQ